MCAEIVDQIMPSGTLVQDTDTRLTPAKRDELILSYLPTAKIQKVAGHRVIIYQDYALLRAQVTHLGRPWPGFKKRIQIPNSWKQQFDDLSSAGMQVKFIGVYAYQDTCIFVDFEPTTYLTRKANNSAAHVSTNDLYQAQVHGTFHRVDRNGNTLTSVRADKLRDYLGDKISPVDRRFEIFKEFNEDFFTTEFLSALDAVREMHESGYSQTFQPEWAGFYLEYRVQNFLKAHPNPQGIEVLHAKTKGSFDYDLRFMRGEAVEFYGDLKASDSQKSVAPGNDASDLARCLNKYGKFWYVIYEYETLHAKNNGDLATIEWNRWKDSVGYFSSRRKPYKELSYRSRFKEAVRFHGMRILEVNPANMHLVLGHFAQGKQASGAARALKVLIKKSNIDNFLVFSAHSEDTSPREVIPKDSSY